MTVPNIQQQKIEWKRKGWSIPELRGKKQEWFQIVLELVELLLKSPVGDLNLCPDVSGVTVEYPWRVYAPFLKGLGLISNRTGIISLTQAGEEFANNPSKTDLATLLHNKYRLFGETLDLINQSPKTIEDVDKELCREYNLDWANLSNTRKRMDWLEVLGLIECIGNRKWNVTKEGLAFLEKIFLVSPDALELSIDDEEIAIAEAPREIYELLQALADNPELHKKRNTYNIWVPSPNRIDNLRTIVQFSYEKVSRSDLFNFIEEEFGLKASSVESMMPFMKADGLLEEVGRNIYIATSAAKAWCESGNDLDFIRILHSHKRFVGEMIRATEKDRVRNDIYAEAKKHGLNTEKSRWIIGFLMEAGLIEEPQYLHLKATPIGMKFIEDLPLFDANYEDEITEVAKETENKTKNDIIEENENTNIIFESLRAAARDPMAEGKSSGLAFEEAIAKVFRYMGYDAKHIGGSGDTDVVVRWKDDKGKTITAVVDGKSKTSGSVAHSDISDVALETHKEKNNAEFVAIVGPGFSGDTIKNHARKKGFALVTDSELVDIAKSSKSLGLSLTDVAHLFKVPNGLSQLDELIAARKRELDIITLVVATFVKEQGAMDSLSARDLYFLLRNTNLSPSLEELLNTFEMLSKGEVGILSKVKSTSAAENVTYSMVGGEHSVNRLRAIASAIESGLLQQYTQLSLKRYAVNLL